MRLKIGLIKISAVLFALFGLSGLVPATAYADCNATNTADALSCGTDNSAGVPGSANATSDLNNTVKNVVDLLSLAVGVAAVVMIIVAGFRYVASAGGAEGAKNAKNTILYAVIGLVIVAFAQLIVHFVLDRATKASNGKTASSQGVGSTSPLA